MRWFHEVLFELLGQDQQALSLFLFDAMFAASTSSSLSLCVIQFAASGNAKVLESFLPGIRT